MQVRARPFYSGRRGFAFLAASALPLVALLSLPAAAFGERSSYQGQFRGTTGQGKPISFVVGGGDRVVSLNLVYDLPGCEVKQQVNTSAPIRGGSFTFKLNLPNNAVSLTGRFTSSSQATGTLTASSDCGRATTTWKAARGGAAPPTTPEPKPKPKAIPTPFQGHWEGKVTFPAGLDPDLKDYLDPPDVMFDIFDGGIEAADFPFLIQGAGCTTGEFAAKELTPVVKVKGKAFSLTFMARSSVKVTLAGTFDSAKRAHGTLTTKGSFEGCEGESRLAWRASNLG
jgi:hypothetical protein